MNRFYNIVLFFLVSALILYDVLYSFVPQTVMRIIQGVGLFWMALSVPIYFRRRRKYTFITLSLILLGLMLISYFMRGMGGGTFIKTSALCILSLFPFTVGNISQRMFKRMGYMFLVLSIFSFLFISSRIRTENELAYGGGYYALVALPVGLYLLSGKEFWKQLLFCFFIFVLVLYSAKRGDIVACALSMIVFFIIDSRHSSQPKSNKTIRLIFTLVVLFVVGWITFRYFLSSSEILQIRYQQTVEGNSSGRDVIYTRLWDYFLKSPFEYKLFGFGFNAPYRILGSSAHSDVLEILLGEGIIGLVLFIAMVFSIILMAVRDSYLKGRRAIIGAIIAIVIVKSIFSMFLFSMPTVLIFSLFGYLLNSRNQYE